MSTAASSPAGSAPLPSPQPDIPVCFAAPLYHSNADPRWIRARLRKLRDAGKLDGMSSATGRLTGRGVKDWGARTLTAQEFAERLNQLPTPGKEKPDAISAAEVADCWPSSPNPPIHRLALVAIA
jgi:hypothetical protein